MKSLSLAMSALLLSTPLALAQTSHTSSDHGTMDHSNMMMITEQMDGAVHANATLHAIGEGTVNVSHGPIPEIGWPAMTMDMALAPDAHIAGISAGDEVVLMLIKGDDGMYSVAAMMPSQ